MESRDDTEQMIKELLQSDEKVEALSWLKGSNKKSHRNLAEWTTEESVQLVQEIYDCGATKVWAVRFDRNPPYESINTLILELPADKKKRRAVFDWSNTKMEEQGFDTPTEDYGQRHVFLWFD